MKITDIRKFASTTRKVHVALSTGSSKDGFLAVVKSTPNTGQTAQAVTMVQVKGDRGRPALIHPTNIDSITWHADTDAKPSARAKSIAAKPATSGTIAKAVKEAQAKVVADIATGQKVTPNVQQVPNKNLRCTNCDKSGVTLTVVKGKPGFKALLCNTCRKGGVPAAQTADARTARLAVINGLRTEVARITSTDFADSAKVDQAMLQAALVLLRNA